MVDNVNRTHLVSNKYYKKDFSPDRVLPKLLSDGDLVVGVDELDPHLVVGAVVRPIRNVLDVVPGNNRRVKRTFVQSQAKLLAAQSAERSLPTPEIAVRISQFSIVLIFLLYCTEKTQLT